MLLHEEEEALCAISSFFIHHSSFLINLFFMTQAFQRLENILKLEAKQGYQDTAVVGGIRQFATFWASQARDETANELDHFFIDQVGEMLSGYNRLPGREARKDTVDSIRAKLTSRAARLAKSGRSASKSKTPQKPAKQRPKAQKKQPAPKQQPAAAPPKPRAKKPERKKPQGNSSKATMVVVKRQ